MPRRYDSIAAVARSDTKQLEDVVNRRDCGSQSATHLLETPRCDMSMLSATPASSKHSSLTIVPLPARSQHKAARTPVKTPTTCRSFKLKGST
eukprot:294713-Rhodomonas_salina.1